ncbi:MAG TPA: GerMN domain-containing protein [Armatimonadota bacterium]|nr:GerMN domain-containing protein [Armatimonadota bacterium]
MKKIRSVAIAIVILACAGLGTYLVINKQSPPPPPPPKPAAHEPIKPPVKVKIYRIAFDDDHAGLRAVEAEVPGEEVPAEGALRCLIEQGDEGNLVNPIPKGTRLLSLEVKDGLATVDLSKEFSDNFAGGSEDEALCIGAILRTLGQFPKIKKVQFKLEGEPLETLGHLDFSGPQDVNWVGTGIGGGN